MKAKFSMLAAAGVLALTGLVASSAWLAESASAHHEETGYVSVPVILTDNGDSVQRLLYARTIELDEGYTYSWTHEQPELKTGTVLVLEVDPDFAYPRQVGVPVLYVGNTPAELTNIGYLSGRMVVIVPGEVDLTTTPIFFGSTELPSQVTKERGDAELQAARDMGIRPFSAAEINGARELGGETLYAFDNNFLMLEVSNLILTYAPDEEERAKLYRLPIEG